MQTVEVVFIVHVLFLLPTYYVWQCYFSTSKQEPYTAQCLHHGTSMSAAGLASMRWLLCFLMWLHLQCPCKVACAVAHMGCHLLWVFVGIMINPNQHVCSEDTSVFRRFRFENTNVCTFAVVCTCYLPRGCDLARGTPSVIHLLVQ
jgi:hypothetical protein